ncbi:MAG: branched-chain amino acid ABC transporter permease [Azospirillaceae bacterium]
MGSTFGIMMYLVGLLTMGGIYAIMALGLNVQWGWTGQFNAGIAGFFAVGAYASAILTSTGSGALMGGFGLPVPVGLVAAMVLAGVTGYLVGRLCLRLKSDYLAIATIGIAEILRLIVTNEGWLTNGTRGVSSIPRPFESLGLPWAQIAFAGLIVALLLVLYVALQRLARSPWGRVLRAIRDNETAAEAVGKNVVAFRLEAFVVGSAIMGLGGALTAHYFKFIGPEATEPLMTTFLVWVMLIVGGSGNNKGAILGPLLVWTLWSAMEIVTAQLPPEWAVRAAYLRIFLVGLMLQVVLQRFAGGLIPERRRGT